MSVDKSHTAVLTAGRIQLYRHSGRSFASFNAPSATAIAARGNTVVATTRAGRLDVFSTGARMKSWRLPSGTMPHVDLQYGIAVVTTRNGVYALNIANGRMALLASTPSLPRAQIETIGVAYTYGRTAMLIPMSRVEAAVR